jgi:hypothetical protein
MLKHCVFLNFRDDVPVADRSAVLQGLGDIMPEVPGMISYDSGPNLDFEGKSPAYDHGFIVTFRDRAAHLAYEGHPRHVELGGQLVSMCLGGHDGIMVVDLDCG